MKNAKQFPKILFGMHMSPGVAYYPEMEGKPLILIEEPALAEMDPTAQGKPVYVHHVDRVDLANLENEMAGVWVRSFFNEADGYHWAEFTVQSDAGHEAVKRGFVLSNSYIPLQEGGAGEYHGMGYKNSVIKGEYEHLALTPTPRYQESAQIGLLTAEEFKAYNEKKLAERKALQNSKGATQMFNLFKKAKLENSAELEGVIVELPKSKKQVELSKLLNDTDEKMEKEAKNEYAADLSHKVKLHDGKMCNVGELLEMHKKLNDEHEATKKELEELKSSMDPEATESTGKENEDESMAAKAKEIEEHEKSEVEEGEKKMNALAELEKMYLDKGLEVPAELKAKLSNSKENYDKLKNAQGKAMAEAAKSLKNSSKDVPEIQTTADRVAVGKAKY